MHVHEIMTANPRTIETDRRLADASELMRIRGIRHLVVLDGAKVVGVMSNRDLAEISRRELEEIRVGDVVSRRIVSIAPEASIDEAADTMLNANVGCLLVMNGETLVGIVTTTDILGKLRQSGRTGRAALLHISGKSMMV
jgi:acetoin utilization protein AcuB